MEIEYKEDKVPEYIKYPIRYCSEENKVYVGKACWDSYSDIDYPKFIGKVAKDNGFSLPQMRSIKMLTCTASDEGAGYVGLGSYLKPCKKDLGKAVKEYNAEMYKAFGSSPKKIFRIFRKLNHKVFVHPIYPCIKAFPAPCGKINKKYVHAAQQHRAILEQLVSDGLEKLGPLCILFRADPKELRVLFGKGNWKKICKMSATRIALLSAHNVPESTLGVWNATEHLRDNLLDKLDIPSTVLGLGRWSPAEMRWAAKHCKGNYKSAKTELQVLRDYKRMAQQLGQVPERNLNLVDLHRKHDEYSRAINAIRNPDYNLEYPKYEYYKNLLKDVDMQGYELKHFKCGSEVQREGVVQNHCIGSYARDMYSGRSLLFSIRKDGEIYSSVQIVKSSPLSYFRHEGEIQMKPIEQTWKVQQHYKSMNRQVDCPKAIQAVQNIIACLNKEENADVDTN